MGVVKPFSAFLSANGSQTPLMSFSVHQSKTKHGDTFKADSAFDMLSQGVAWWTTQKNIDVQIIVNGTKIFDGVIDHTDYDWSQCKIDFSGRDKGSALMDKTTSQKFLNQTPSQIVQTMAGAAGVSSNVDTPGGMAGTIYTTDMAKITNRGSQWSAVNELADLFGMNTYMTGGTLYFKNSPESLPLYPINYTRQAPGVPTSNAVILKTSRNHILGRPVTTNVHSHNHKKKTVVTATVNKSGSGAPLIYNHVTRPGLTQDQATRIANKKHAEVTQHEYVLDGLEIPGDEALTPLFMVSLSGTGTAFDQTYAIASVDHEGKYDGGYTCKIDCKKSE